jgi:hypothetical protein
VIAEKGGCHEPMRNWGHLDPAVLLLCHQRQGLIQAQGWTAIAIKYNDGVINLTPTLMLSSVTLLTLCHLNFLDIMAWQSANKLNQHLFPFEELATKLDQRRIKKVSVRNYGMVSKFN